MVRAKSLQALCWFCFVYFSRIHVTREWKGQTPNENPLESSGLNKERPTFLHVAYFSQRPWKILPRSGGTLSGVLRFGPLLILCSVPCFHESGKTTGNRVQFVILLRCPGASGRVVVLCTVNSGWMLKVASLLGSETQYVSLLLVS